MCHLISTIIFPNSFLLSILPNDYISHMATMVMIFHSFSAHITSHSPLHLGMLIQLNCILAILLLYSFPPPLPSHPHFSHSKLTPWKNGSKNLSRCVWRFLGRSASLIWIIPSPLLYHPHPAYTQVYSRSIHGSHNLTPPFTSTVYFFPTSSSNTLAPNPAPSNSAFQ